MEQGDARVICLGAEKCNLENCGFAQMDSAIGCKCVKWTIHHVDIKMPS
jgi:hypothetical protein